MSLFTWLLSLNDCTVHKIDKLLNSNVKGKGNLKDFLRSYKLGDLREDVSSHEKQSGNSANSPSAYFALIC